MARPSLFTRAREAAGRRLLSAFAYVTPKPRQVAVIKESLGGTLVGDYSLADPDMVGYRRLTDPEGTYRRELDSLSRERMLKIAHFLYASNPMARFLIDKPVGLAVGREIGYSVEINADQAKLDPEAAVEMVARIRKVLDRFWEHPTHDLRHRAMEYATTYRVSGHLILPVVTVNDVDGVPQLDVVDAAQLRGVEAVKGSSMVPGVVKINGPAGYDEKRLAVIRPDGDGELKGREHYEDGVTFDGECFYFRRARLLNSLEGISDLMDVADWLDGHDQFLFASLDRAILKNNLVWDLKMEGATEEKLNAEMKKLQGALAKAGGMYGHNEQTELTPKVASFEGAEMSEVARLFRIHILGSKGIPESWYSEGGNANRATAGEQTDVALKELVSFQEEMRRIFRMILHYAYDHAQAAQAGPDGENLPDRSEPWLTIEPQMPTLVERDASRASAAFTQTVAAVGSALADELISRQTARKLVLQFATQLGVQVDPDEEKKQIEAEAEEREEADAEARAAKAKAGLEDVLNKNLGPEGPPAASEVPA